MSRYLKIKDTTMTMEQPTAKQLFFSAIELKAKDRSEFLLEACKGNDPLYKEVLSLIASYEQAEAFLEKPAADFAAKLILENKDNYGLTDRSRFLEEIIGTIIDSKYLVEKQLGEGGMGTVYKAIHQGTDRPVAVKIITPQFMSNNEFVERFKREAKAMGRLSHPNVINVTDFGVTEFNSQKVAYIVMEYLKGLTLGQFLKEKGKLSVSFAIDLLEQISSAINEAHLQGIIHRDLKPDNIWLEPDGRGSYHIKVLDFGLAKLYTDNSLDTDNVAAIKDESPNLDETKEFKEKKQLINIDIKGLNEKQTQELLATQTVKSRLVNYTNENMTRAGTILGTPLYMSPEQCQGLRVDSRSDIYSLGIIAYEMFCGFTPFKGDFKELINKHLTQDPEPLYKVNRAIPKSISDLVMVALSKKALDRFPSAKAFTTSLQINFEEESPLIEQAGNIYWKNLYKITNISLIINLFCVICLSSLSAIIIHYNFRFNNYLFNILWWVIPIIVLSIFNNISQGAFALIIRDLQEKHKISLSRVLTIFIKHIPTILILSAKNYLFLFSKPWKSFFPSKSAYIHYSLSAPIITLEGLKGVQIMERSKDLLSRFYSLAFSLKVRSLLIRSIAFIMFLFSFLVSIWLSNGNNNFYYKMSCILISTLLFPGLFLVFASPITNMAVTLLYVKVREAKGETSYQLSLNAENEILSKGLKFSLRRKVFTSIALIASIVVAIVSYLIIVPPFSEPVKALPPSFEKIPDSENAWVEYDLAIQSVTPVSMRLGNTSNLEKDSYYSLIRDNTLELTKSIGFKGLEEAGMGQVGFSQDNKALLDKHQKALSHILLGIKRPKAQYYVEAPNIFFVPPSFIQHRALIIIACAQARRLFLDGKTKESVELALAAYHMSTDLARDANALSIQIIASTLGRAIAAKTLFFIINSPTVDSATALEIAREVSRLDSLMPNAYQPYIQEAQAMNSSLRDIFVEGKSFRSDEFSRASLAETIIKYLPGLRIRMYNFYVEASQKYSDNIRTSAEAWDFSGLYKSASLESNKRFSIMDSLSDVVLAGSHPYTLNLMKSLYRSNVLGSSLVSFAVCVAYKKNTGYFPSNLENAMKEVQIPMPIDFVTKKAMGYRLENNEPTVWFAGIDGKDNNGQSSYKNLKLETPEEGKDIVFVYSKISEIEQFL